MKRHRIGRLLGALTVALLAAAAAGSCGQVPVPTDQVTIGIALPANDPYHLLLRGAEVAAREINAAGGVAGRRIVLVAEAPLAPDLGETQDRRTADAGRRQAMALAAHRPLAVIGHESPDGASAAALLYQPRNILFLSTYPSDETLSARSLDLVFLMTLPTRFIYEALARHAYDQGWCQLILVRERTNLGVEHGLFFKKYAQAFGLTVTSYYSFQEGKTSFLPEMLDALNDAHTNMPAVDALAFIGTSAEAGAFLRDARHLKITQPVLAPWFAVNPEVFHLAGPAIDGTVSHTLFDQRTPTPELEAFTAAFLKEFGVAANSDALLAYDSVRVLAHVIERTGSVDPHLLGSHLQGLRYTGPYQGFNGPIAFDVTGNRVGSIINIVNLTQKQFEYVSLMQDEQFTLDALKQLPPPTCRSH